MSQRKQCPALYRAHDLLQREGDWPLQMSRFGWQYARPINAFGLRVRLLLAWRVLTGQYDALSWEHPQDGAA